MSKMNVADAAEHFGISKEAIHNRIRRGSLNSVIEDGVKLVLIDDASPASSKPQTKRASASSDDKYYKLLEEQNVKLQERVEKLEDETRTLRDQKELMLVQEREKIEEIYKQKDEQLKNILNAISSKFMLNAPSETVDEDTHLDVEIEDVEQKSEEKIISLKKYLKQEGFSKKKTDKIKTRFDKHHKNDNRIIVIGKKYYINTAKYDYSDLL